MRVKNLMFLAMMFLAAPLCSCSDDDDDKKIQDPEKEVSVATTMKMKIDVTLSEDLFTVADVHLGYINANGEQVSEKLTSPKIDKVITAPIEKVKDTGMGYGIFLQSKRLEAHEVDHYAVGSGSHSSAWQVLDQQGKVMDGDAPSTTSTLAVGADKIEEYLQKRAKLVEKAYKVSADGKLESTTIAWGFNFI